MKDEMMETTDKTPIEVALQVDDEGFTTARRMYAWLDLNASHYSRWAEQNITGNPFAEAGVDYSPLMASKGKGNLAKDYKISSSLAKRISMASKSERGEQARAYFLGCEAALKRVAEQKRQTELERAKGIAVRQALTNALKVSGENERMHGHAYSTYTDMIYRIIFGKSAKQLKELYGLPGNGNLRDCLSQEELAMVGAAEMLASAYMAGGYGYQEVKGLLEPYGKRLLAMGKGSV